MLLACSSPNVRLSVDGFALEVTEVIEFRVTLVDFEHHGTRSTKPRRDQPQFVVTVRFDPEARPAQPSGAAATNLLLDLYLTTKVGEIADEPEHRRRERPPQNRGDDECERTGHERSEHEREHRALTECVTGFSGEGVGFGIESATAAPPGYVFAHRGSFVGVKLWINVRVHQVLRGIAVVVRFGLPGRITAVSRCGSSLYGTFVSAVQHTRSKRRIRGLPNPGAVVDEHGDQNEQPHDNKADPEK